MIVVDCLYYIVYNNSDYLKKACKYGQITGQGHRIYYQITTFGKSLDTLTTSREMPATRTAHQTKIEYDTAEAAFSDPFVGEKDAAFFTPKFRKINYQMSTLKMSGGGNASSWLKSA